MLFTLFAKLSTLSKKKSSNLLPLEQKRAKKSDSLWNNILRQAYSCKLHQKDNILIPLYLLVLSHIILKLGSKFALRIEQLFFFQ